MSSELERPFGQSDTVVRTVTDRTVLGKIYQTNQLFSLSAELTNKPAAPGAPMDLSLITECILDAPDKRGIGGPTDSSFGIRTLRAAAVDRPRTHLY